MFSALILAVLSLVSVYDVPERIVGIFMEYAYYFWILTACITAYIYGIVYIKANMIGKKISIIMKRSK